MERAGETFPAGLTRNRYPDVFLHGTFPEGFAWGTATASYQIEGAYDIDGRGPSIWDTYCRQPGRVQNGDTGDVACDHYQHYMEDVQLMKDLGTSHYRLSLSWSRIMPDGTPASLNPAGLAFYHRLFDAMLAAGITPLVTLYHWDLPQPLQDKGGWPNPELADHFVEYARVCFEEFGDKVKMWTTFNEPVICIFFGYGSGLHAPGIKDPLGAAFPGGHTLIKAHARAYRLYDSEFRQKQGGQCGIVLVAHWNEPKDPNNPEDVAAAERALQTRMGWFANPIFGNGDYPDLQKEILANLSKTLGLPKSALPEFTEEEKALNKGSADFLGLNHYSTRLTTSPDQPLSPSHPGFLANIIEGVDAEWERGKSSFLYVVPWGLRKMINWMTKTYNHPTIYITENGYSDSGEIKDSARIKCLRGYINEVLKATVVDGCDVRGYFTWSLMDNFEWTSGYADCFGLYHVDFNDPNRKRTPKDSVAFYKKLVKDNGFPKQGKM